MRLQSRGVLLLEVLVALTIFAFAGAFSVALLAQLSDAETRAHRDGRRLADESRLLTAYVLLTRGELEQRLGSRVVGPYLVDVARPDPSLYRVAIGDSTGADLTTLIYRPANAR